MDKVRLRYILLIFILTLFSQHSFGQLNFWQESDGPYGGHIWNIVGNPQGCLFATTYSRLFRSTDAGASWRTCRLDSMWVEGGGGLCVDSSGRLFLGHQYGVIVSTDMGGTWKETGTMPISNSARAIAIDSSGNLYVGTWRQGFFRSSNHGESWSRCSADSLTALCLVVNQRTNVILAGSEKGIYRSSNGGTSWSFVDLGDAQCTAIIVHSSGNLYATSSTSQSGVYKSTDDGLTWALLNSPLRYCYALLSTNTGRLIVGSAWGMYASDDAGSSWTRTGLQNEIALAFWSNNDNHLYAGTSGGGVYISSNQGETWREANNGMIGAHIRAIASGNDGHIYAAWHKKIHRSNDFGATFQESFHSSSDEVTTVAVDSKGNAYAIVMDTIFISTNNGSSWEVASATGIWQPPWALTVDPSDNLFFVTRSAAVYRSTDQGQHWTNVYVGGGIASYLNIAFASDGTGFFTADANIFRSTNSGLSWAQIGQNLHTNGSQSFCIDRQGVIFLGTNGIGVLRSTDKGESWSETNAGLPSTDRWIRFIVATGNQLLVNTSSYYYPPGYTTYHSTNNGASWFRESSGLPNDFVTALTATPSGYMYIGTQFNGFYRSQIAIDGVTSGQEIRQFSLFQNYPNPFNPSTTISYTLPHSALVTLTVYDVLGRQVAKLTNGRQHAGFNEVVFHADGISSGVYLYRLEADSYTATKKLLLLK